MKLCYAQCEFESEIEWCEIDSETHIKTKLQESRHFHGATVMVTIEVSRNTPIFAHLFNSICFFSLLCSISFDSHRLNHSKFSQICHSKFHSVVHRKIYWNGWLISYSFSSYHNEQQRKHLLTFFAKFAYDQMDLLTFLREPFYSAKRIKKKIK